MALSGRLAMALTAGIAALALTGGLMFFSQTEVSDPAINPLPNPNPTVIRDWAEAARRQDLGLDGRNRHRPGRARLGLRPLRFG